MEHLHDAADLILHLDVHLVQWAGMLGPWLYGLLFVIVFCETGLVVTPFLPGDSLLFAVGAICAVDGSPVNIVGAIFLLIVAAVLGDAVNYSIGAVVGPKVFSSEGSRLLNRRHLFRAKAFYDKHGGKTIVLARFMPVIRTFAPFVAGIGQMQYRRFAAFNVTGGVAWVTLFLGAGYLFGNVPVVKRNFHVVIIAIVLISLMPPIIEYLRSRSDPEHTPLPVD
jgi:membrane-associated protein